MGSSDSHGAFVPSETVIDLAAAVDAVHALENRQRMTRRLVFSHAHTQPGAQLLTLMYSDKLLRPAEAALSSA